jgi:predicted AAA+ superfamily ATPase
VTKRYLQPIIADVLTKKMVFISGPRQVGKTTLALQFLSPTAKEDHPGYLNWDYAPHASLLRTGDFLPDQPVIVLDEIHKYKFWRRTVKGIYDTRKSRQKIVVTGSARLDIYRKGGDSLLGRYRHFRLHPLSLGELYCGGDAGELIDRLLQFGGFPEPFLAQNPPEHRIWSRDRMQKIIREDLRDLANVREISLLEQLADLLPRKAAGLLSIKSLAEDLEVDHKTVKRWLQIFESLYISFRIAPFGSPAIRAVKKEQKIFLWDWSTVNDPGARWENLVACQLLKYCHFIEDTQGYKMELRFIRDTDKREIDFVVLKDGKPIMAVECKTGDKALSPHLFYFAERTAIPAFYQIHRGRQTPHRATAGSTPAAGDIKLMNFADFCKELGMP